MSGLYIKLFTGFYSNRKTARLRSRIGDDAFWIPPRLWAYAAEHQADGNFSGYTSEELAMLLGCDKHASSILAALTACGFIDEGGMLHDWEEHNGFHSTFSKRAQKAADARWKKEKNQKKEVNTDTETDTETSIASSMLVACSKDASSIETSKASATASLGGLETPLATNTKPAPEKPPSDGKAAKIEAFKIRVGSMMKRRPTTAWSEKEMKALKFVLTLETPEEDILTLERYYGTDNPYLRRDILTLLNNWNGEIDRAKRPTGATCGRHQGGDGRANRNADIADLERWRADFHKDAAEAARAGDCGPDFGA